MKNRLSSQNEKLPAILESLELPELQMPVHQQQLRKALLASACFKREDRLQSRWINSVKPKAWVFAASFAIVILALGSYLTYFTASQPVANLMLQVNPAFTITLSAGNTVLGAEGLDEQAKSLLAGLDVTGKHIRESLRVIVGALQQAGLLEGERRISLALHPVGDRLGEAELTALTATVSKMLDSHLAEQGLPAKVVNASLTAELSAAVSAAGLLPGDYAELVATLGPAATKQLLALQKELGLDQALFREEFGTINAALYDLTEAGLTADEALAVLKTAFAADPTLKRLTTIVAAVIDLMEEGLSKEEALARIQAAIKLDPTWQNFEDLIELPEKEETDESGSHLPDKPQNDGRETGTEGKEMDEAEGPDHPESDKHEKETAPEEDAADKHKQDKNENSSGDPEEGADEEN